MHFFPTETLSLNLAEVVGRCLHPLLGSEDPPEVKEVGVPSAPEDRERHLLVFILVKIGGSRMELLWVCGGMIPVFHF